MRRRTPDDQGVTAVIGTILVVAVAITLSAAVYALVQLVNGGKASTPRAFLLQREDAGGGFHVMTAPRNVDWSELAIVNCTTVPTGLVQAGQVVSGCTGHVTVTDKKANALVAQFDF